jgi:thiamine pyrophosphate-dependent acetolactate synthase large subunit-like protein
MLRLTGGEALLRSLLPESIPFVFGIVGGKLGPFLQALAQQPAIRYVGARHEGHAAMMAGAVFAASGKLGVVVGECGSGGGNLVPGITIANANSLSMFVITSNNQHHASYPGRGMFAEMDTERVFRSITKWNTAVHDGRRIPELVRRGLREALTGRPGPVHLDVPQDILRGTFDYDEREFAALPSGYRAVEGPAPTGAQIDSAVSLLLASKRPLLLAGGGVTASGATGAFRALVKALNAAAAATQMGSGNVSASDPNFLGLAWVCGGDAIHQACAEADVVLAVGCRFSSWLRNDRGPILGAAARVIHIDIDPGIIGQHVPVAAGIVADARTALEAILAAVALRLPSPPARPWLEQLSQTYRDYRDKLETLAADRAPIMHPAALASAIARCMPAQALATFDGGHTTFWSNDFSPGAQPRTRFNEPGMSQLGFGLPWALALKLLYPERPVINITGDGAFGFSLQELDTAKRYGLPVVNIIHNNASWGIIKFGYAKAGFNVDAGKDMGTELANTNYADIARGFGGHGELVERVEDVEAALDRAIQSNLPAVLDCRVRFEPHPGLPYFARMSSAGA